MSEPTISPAAVPPVPSPADMPSRAGLQPPTPVLPQTSAAGDDEQVLLDHRTNAPMTQAAFAKIMARENAKARRAVLREMSEAAGIPFDPENLDPSPYAQALKDAQAARQAQLSEEQRRTEELQRREQALQAREDAAVAREKEAAARDRDTRIRQALVTLGATGADLDDAAALLRVPDDADDAAITQAAEQLKERRGEMFGTGPAAQALPPAPSGGPAGGNAPRQPATGAKEAVQQEARRIAEAMGYRRKSDAA
ncbi:hypothetical protein [Streptomyces bottropensis]|uniref:hypothetical protein n=1 Tax=Streptomyces bottropensis TaxID=42235 RepID=UPI003693CC37